MNKTAIDVILEKWNELETFFSDYEIDGAQEICLRFRQEMRNAQEDLPRRWALIEKLSTKIAEQQSQRNESQENRAGS